MRGAHAENLEGWCLMDASTLKEIPIIDVDSHVVEPPDLWSSRMASQWRDQAPRVSWDDAANEAFTSLPSPDEFQGVGVAGLRYAARWWYLMGHLNRQRAPMALREAARCFRQAGCLNASKAAAKRLHRVL